MILFIDTTEFKSAKFALIDPSAAKPIQQHHDTLSFNENYKTLEMLEKFLKAQKTTPQDLTKIVVCSGPGSFTGIRVGLALSQAMAYALHIPLLTLLQKQIPEDLQKLSTKKVGKSTGAQYGLKPNITPAKKKVLKKQGIKKPSA